MERISRANRGAKIFALGAIAATTAWVCFISYSKPPTHAGEKAEPAPPLLAKGLNAVLILLLFFAGLAIVCAVGLVQAHGWESLADYFAYLFPVAAGIGAGLIIYYPESPRRWFWIPGILLIFGLLSYVASKGVSVRIVATTSVVFAALFTAGLIYDERAFRAVRRTRVDRFSRAFLPVALGVMIIESGYFIAQALASHPTACQIMLANPTRASIIMTEKNTMRPKRTPGGISPGGWDLGEVSRIVISECPHPSPARSP